MMTKDDHLETTLTSATSDTGCFSSDGCFSSRRGQQNRDDGSADSSSSSMISIYKCTSWRVSFPLMIIALIGAGVSSAFLAVGIRSAYRDQELQFERHASELVASVEATWKDYHLGGLWIQEGCRSTRTSHRKNNMLPPMCSREDFRGLYEYLTAGGLEFQAIAYVPNVTHQYRAAMEQEAAQYYDQEYPLYNYTGFTGFTKTDPQNPRAIGRSPDKPFYFLQHLVEPVQGNERFIDFDLYSSSYSWLIDESLQGWHPVITAPVPVPSPGMRQVILIHPGAKLSTSNNSVSCGVSSITIPFWALMKRSVKNHPPPEPAVSAYIFDTTRTEAFFFGGAQIQPLGEGDTKLNYVANASLQELRLSRCHRHIFEKDIAIEQQVWTVVVVAEDGTYQPELTFVVVGGCLIVAICACVTVWLYSAMRKEAQIAKIRQDAEAQKSALVVESAQKAAQVERQAALSERQLNEYLSHEVRNPLSSAMTAASFLSASVSDSSKDVNSNNHQEDINVIRSSLSFINDLLRSMLDMHKLQSKQLQLEEAPTDVLKDILEPVRTILHPQRDSVYRLEVDCPENLVVMADRMRVKQIVLNLASNSRKFVEQGFIRLRAKLIPGRGGLELWVEDSGPGIPQSKRSRLFERFQSSLDSLNQGTGMGLSLCKNLVELMNGSIIFDDSFDSGVAGCPGARFVISLPGCHQVDLGPDGSEQPTTMPSSEQQPLLWIQSPLEDAVMDEMPSSASGGDIETGITNTNDAPGAQARDEDLPRELPEKFHVLVVDDDLVLRKLLCRSLKRAAPGWTIKEASNGETALIMAETNCFDLILMDQYMASVDKQLLGTETVYALRAKGIQCLICGLSANDMEESFLKSGADAFLQKPFSCDQPALRQDLLAVLGSRQSPRQ